MPFTQDFPDTYGPFKLEKKLIIEEIQSVLFELTHLPSGAKVIHIGHEDDENLFCISLKTYPDSSNGVAHILEHTVLCGSKKFPVKDPFFSMTRRSLNTFMNAMTGMDFTCYPAASQNQKDFYHLFDVYLDAVFHPILDERSFQQEGHRLEFEDPEDSDTPLTYQGIVYNEMKGSLNSAESRLYRKIYEVLFPDLPYRFNSGGNPESIPHLTYQGLKEFHKKFYHPSQAIFFFYGNIPLESHLDFLEKNLLNSATKQPAIEKLGKQPRFLEPKEAFDFFPVVEKIENQDFMALAFLTIPIENQIDYLSLLLIEEILMGSDAAFLKHYLQSSGLLVQADSFLDGEMSEIPFVFIIRGIEAENAKKIESFILEGLNQFIKKPIPIEKIESALHQLTLERLEISDDHGPYGLSLFMRSILLMQHGANPEDGLFLHRLIDQLKEKIQSPDYLPQLIRRYLIDNRHRALVVLKGDPNLGKKETEQEKTQLEQLKFTFSKADQELIIKQTKALEAFQKQQEEQNTEILPSLELSDIPASVNDFPLKSIQKNQLNILYHPTWTNGFIYSDLIFEIPNLKANEWPIAKFFLSHLSELGAGGRSYQETLDLLQGKTGGIQGYVQILTNPHHLDDIQPTFGIKGKTLEQNRTIFFQLIKDFLKNPNLKEPARIRDLITQHYTYLRDKLNRSGLSYCIKQALEGFHPSHAISQQIGGLPYYQFVQKLASLAKTDLDSIIEDLEKIKTKLFHYNHPELILSVEPKTIQHLNQENFFDIGQIPSHPYTPWIDLTRQNMMKNYALEISSSVSFVCEGFSVFGLLDPLSPALSLATCMMDNLVLHPLIREQGGAYGSGATYQPMSGTFYFHSYRDPQIVSTFDAFQQSIRTLIDDPIDEQILKDAKFELIQELDAPVSPGMRAYTTYLYEKTGRTKEFREEYKKKILAVSLSQIKEAVKKAFSHQKGKKVFAVSHSRLQKEKNLLEKAQIDYEIIKV